MVMDSWIRDICLIVFLLVVCLAAGMNMSPVSRLKKTWSKVKTAKFDILEVSLPGKMEILTPMQGGLMDVCVFLCAHTYLQLCFVASDTDD